MTESRRTRRKLLRVLSLLLLLAALAGWFRWQQTGLSTEELTAAAAPDGFAGYRIAVVSDLHGREFGREDRRLLAFTAALEPDLIAVTGDLIHDPAQLPVVPPLARGLAAIAPTYYVTGNHEWAAGVVGELEPLLERCGVAVLSNEAVLLERNGDRIALLGAEDANGPAGQKSVSALAKEARAAWGEDVYTILLSHRNDHEDRYVRAGVDLTLCGHAHGGLIRLPGTDGLIGPGREWFPTHTAGLYRLERGELAVSRGLGDKFPAFRLFDRPDVPVVVLR